jgi:hypothetical protein
MSVRAAEAYYNEKKPLSKWGKHDILSCLTDPKILELAKKLTLKNLKACFLISSGEWHHTSKFFNETNFYAVDDGLEETDVISFLDTQNLKKALPKQKIETVKKTALVNYVLWEGSRKHPKAIDKTGIARWTEKNGKSGLVEIENEYKKFRLSSLQVVKYL